MAIQEPQYLIRPAQKRECRRIAELYRISSDGVADYIWTKLAQGGEDILEVGRKRYEREGTPFSYENCKLVELEESAVGMLVAFPMKIDEEYEETDPILVHRDRTVLHNGPITTLPSRDSRTCRNALDSN
jgi:hypothetical protein